MMRFLVSSLIVAVSFLSAAADAAVTRERPGWANGCRGSWHTGEITESAYADRWGYGATDQGHINRITADSENRQAGDASIRLYTECGFDTWACFPNTKDLELDGTKLESISFLLHTENDNGWGPDCWVIVRDMDRRGATFHTLRNRMKETLTGWVPYAIPVGAAAAADSSAVEAAGWRLDTDDGFEWDRLASVEVHADTGGYGFVLYLDDMQFVAADGEDVKWWVSAIGKPDLTATYAERLPRTQRYLVDYSDVVPRIKPERQDLKRWPDDGERVTWNVHVRNEGFAPSPKAGFACAIDGRVVHREELPAMPPRTERIVSVPWDWDQGAHRLVVTLDPDGAIDEITKKNNVLDLQTDAYTLFAVVEKTCAAKVAEVNNSLGSFSFEDWLRSSTVDRMNWMMADSTYDFAPRGTRARGRIDQVIYVDSIKDMPAEEKPVDLIDGGWYYPEASWIEYCNLANTYMWALCHELSHQFGIIDNYQINLPADRNQVNGKEFSQPDGGSMGGGRTGGRGRTHYSDMTIAGYDATYGHRRGYFGEYLWSVPDRNTVEIRVDGRPVADTEITVYQKKWDEGRGRDGTGNGTIPDTPVMTGRTDGRGRYEFENRPVLEEYTTATGCTLKPNPFGYIDVVGRNGLLLLRAEVDGRRYYGFMDIGRFTVEYARGHRDHGRYQLDLVPEDD